jgi:hypothetical protein
MSRVFSSPSLAEELQAKNDKCINYNLHMLGSSPASLNMCTCYIALSR